VPDGDGDERQREHRSGASSIAYRPLTYTQPVSPATPPAGFLTIGNETARLAALRASGSGRLHRTILVHGPRGAGKDAFVEDLLALLLCAAPDGEERPCNACRACHDARSRSHPDLVLGSPEIWREARSTGESIVGVARRWLLESSGTPVAGEWRVILIEHVDRANEQTQNALLKALEEPSPRQMFVLVADDLGRVLPTIRSRAQLLRVGAVPKDRLVALLVDRHALPADSAEALALMADGLPGRAVELAKHAEVVEWRRRVQSELLSLLWRDRADRFESIRDLLDQAAPTLASEPAQPDPDEGEAAPRTSSAQLRSRALQIVEIWRSLARDLLVSAAGRPERTPGPHLHPEFASTAAALPPEELTAFLRQLDRIGDGLEQNAAPRLALDVAMLAWPRLVEPARSGTTTRR
jgi:hypothetical protein